MSTATAGVFFTGSLVLALAVVHRPLYALLASPLVSANRTRSFRPSWDLLFVVILVIENQR